MRKGKAIVKNERGIHARPSGEIAKEALKYKSKISVIFKDKTANAKDVIQLIILEMLKDSEVEIIANGEDEDVAFEAVKELIEKEYIFD